MYHTSILNGVPQERGVYVLKRMVSPYLEKTGTRVVDRVAVVGMADRSQQNGLKGRLKQYLCERTDTATIANIRNAAVARIEAITHVECYLQEDIFKSRDHALAVESIFTELLEPMWRTPKSKSKTTQKAQELVNDESFRQKVESAMSSPSIIIRLPNIDNIIADIISINGELGRPAPYGAISNTYQSNLSDY